MRLLLVGGELKLSIYNKVDFWTAPPFISVEISFKGAGISDIRLFICAEAVGGQCAITGVLNFNKKEVNRRRLNMKLD